MDLFNPNQPNPIPMSTTPNTLTKLATNQPLKAFGYGYIVFCVSYVTLSIFFSAVYQIAKYYSH